MTLRKRLFFRLFWPELDYILAPWIFLFEWNHVVAQRTGSLIFFDYPRILGTGRVDFYERFELCAPDSDPRMAFVTNDDQFWSPIAPAF